MSVKEPSVKEPTVRTTPSKTAAERTTTAKRFDTSAFISRFKEETNEHLVELEKDLLRLERNTRDHQLLDDMMREAHTLKGSATMMGYKRIAELAHAFEDALSQIKKGGVEPGDPHFELLLQVLDTMKPLMEDKLTWPESGVDQTHVEGLMDTLRKTFSLAGDRQAAGSRKTGAAAKRKGAPRKRPPAEKTASTPEIAEMEIPPEKTEAGNTAAGKTDQAPAVAELAESIRVDVRKLNQLMNLTEELVIEKIRVDQRKFDLNTLSSKLEELHQKLSQTTDKESALQLARNLRRDYGHIVEEFSRTTDEIGFLTSQLQQSVMGVRMLPLDIIFRKFPRAMRDLAKVEQKVVDFSITGEETELDKTVIEKIQDPLMHILRNAVSHGIESPDERRKKGKAEAGTIELRAYPKGSQVIIEVDDDGGGIDTEKVKKAAVEKGILSAEEAKRLSKAQALQLLFASGLSTKRGVSQVSGRGVGLDVVRTNVTQLKGLIDIQSEIGKGSRFIIKLPLTLAITTALFVRVGDEIMALPLDNIEETIRITHQEIKTVEGREAITVRDEIIPLIRLGTVLGLSSPGEIPEQEYVPVVIVGVAEKKLAILVDDMIGKLEVVAKNLGDHLKKVPHIAGATLLGTGAVVMILNIPSLIVEASNLRGLENLLPDTEEEIEDQPSILIVEDSFITRDLERSILEAANYKVGLAMDGAEALERLAAEKYDLVVTDISMPGMDGIEMIRRMKSDKRFREIPVVVVSSRETQEDKKRGLEVGASAYLGKGSFDQANLLDTVERLIG
jgi:two-component system chemotaxis sensor kinase CheA